ncbi:MULTISPECIES: hypothetical protein [unclassified Ensifer]|uniref:hypothetical protein n=1 Tax=unclassified Ensifer TaxID=2633371 RepID=UPI000812C937|nr:MULTISPECIES: hypothetical protein [unclassified Ensifer]OCP22024.1 hypothetical protein BC361_26010 [Ensifer sp. LC54]OCP23196.1 hypothetical protein BC363_24755 [Ensifer sp. LC384]
MALQRTYHRNLDYPSTDPGNELRDALSELEVDEEQNRKFGELLYTASERGILDFHLDSKDAATVLRLVALSAKIKGDDVSKFRM